MKQYDCLMRCTCPVAVAERAVVKAAMAWNAAAGATWDDAEAGVTSLEDACDRLLAARKKAGR